MRPAVIGLVALPVVVGGLGITAAVVVFNSGTSADQGHTTSTPAAGADSAHPSDSDHPTDSARTTESGLHDTRIHGTRPHLTVIQGGANTSGLGALPAILSALPPLATDLAPLSAAEEHAPNGRDQTDDEARVPHGVSPESGVTAPGSLPSVPGPLPGGWDPLDPLSRLGDAVDTARAGASPLDGGPRGTRPDGEHTSESEPGTRPGIGPGTEPSTRLDPWLDTGRDAEPGARPDDDSPDRPSPESGWRDLLPKPPGQGVGPSQDTPPHADATGRSPHADTTGPPPHARKQAPSARAHGDDSHVGGGRVGGGGDSSDGGDGGAQSETVTYPHPEAG